MLWLILVPFYFSPFFPIGFRFGLSSMKSPCQCHCCDCATGIFSVSVRLWKWARSDGWLLMNLPCFLWDFCSEQNGFVSVISLGWNCHQVPSFGSWFSCWFMLRLCFSNEVRVINLTPSENGLREWFHLKMNSQTFMLAVISKTVLGYTIFSWNSSNVYRAFL